MWAYLCVSRTYRVGIVSDNRSVTYPRLSFLSPSLSFVSSTRNIFLPPRRRPFVFPPVLDCTKKARRGHFIHENNPVTGVTCLLPYKSIPSTNVTQRSIRREWKWFSTPLFRHSAYLINGRVLSDPTRVIVPSLLSPPSRVFRHSLRHETIRACRATRYTGIKL